MKALTVVVVAAFFLTSCVSRESGVARIKSEVAKVFAEERHSVRFEARLKELGARISAGMKPGERVAEIPLVVRPEYSRSLLVTFIVQIDGSVDSLTCDEVELIADSRFPRTPNKAPEPTPGSVTPRAEPRVTPAPSVAHL